MQRLTKQDRVDELINHFWKNGYLTLSRRYGTYLPTPKPIGNYRVDAVGKYKRKYAIGLLLTTEELDSSQVLKKIEYLATRNSRNSQNGTTLFIGVKQNDLLKAKLIIAELPDKIKKNLRLVISNNSQTN